MLFCDSATYQQTTLAFEHRFGSRHYHTTHTLCGQLWIHGAEGGDWTSRPVALMSCHVSTQLTNRCAVCVSAFTLKVSDTFFHLWSALLIVILQHTECFLPSEGMYLCVKWCLVCSNKLITLRNHLTLIFRFLTSASLLLSNPNVNEASGRPTWNLGLNGKYEFFSF